ncbi:TraM recognition domain-containing protein [Piscirickettsia salmonis]|uniref:TraM recognition domain-containing protein n=1 Tax=Piscirickettsia salmonis TaxID=1238 RepID=UPI0007C8FA7C|nr:AAA-like domain protein [Piscirickettsiaceae bacterium NZ-RLO1]
MQLFRGITKSQEQHQANAIRDIRPMHLRLAEIINSRIGSTFIILGCILLVFVFPYLSDLIILLMLFVFLFTMGSRIKIPFKKPVFYNKPDENNPKPGSSEPGKSEGIYHFGNEVNSNHELWFNNSDMRTHCLIFGSTGSGKTETLLSISYNALVQGSGFIYVDGKGDNSLFAKVFSMVRSLGREDDLLVINFMTGARDIIGPQADILSNTMNPFADGSSSMLSQLVVSMMESGGGGQDSGGGDMWKGRAISFIESLMRFLVYLRDQDKLLLDAGTIRRYFTLEALEGLYYDNKVLDEMGNEVIFEGTVPFDVKDPLDNYLASLPGYRKDKKGEQSDKVYEQHGYIIMQLTRIFSSLADVYGHIIKTNLAEVDFRDVILNRRILVVLLPALEKSPDELSNLGKLIIASLKAMLAAGLGDKVEGDYKDVIETKPTNSNTPYLCVLDEYGYYAVKGFAVVPAQARSLGFSVVFAGQDLPAFQKASKEEAASICANTNIKICMKLEDPQETWEFFQKTAGEAYVSTAKSFNMDKSSATMSYKDSMEATFDKRNRVDLLDLKDQREGEGHVFFKSNIVRMKAFYANPPKVKYIKLNQFVKIEPPSPSEIKLIKEADAFKYIDNISEKYNNYNHSEESELIFSEINKKIIEIKADDEDKNKDYFNSSQVGLIAEHLIEVCNAQHQAVEDEDEDEEYDEEYGEEITVGSDIGADTDIDVKEALGSSRANKRYDIFMDISLEDRLESDYFDFEVSSLESTLVDKKQINIAVEKILILSDIGLKEARAIVKDIVSDLSAVTTYKGYADDGDIDIEQLLVDLAVNESD